MDRTIPFDRRLPLATPQFVEADPSTHYTLRDGTVYWRGYRIKTADAPTFGFYLGGFASDAKSCYRQNSRLTKADPATFRGLNFTFFKDRNYVWTIFGEVKKADAGSFVAADTGALESYGCWMAFGFGKDKNGVYYVGVYGSMGWLTGVDPASFVSTGDGHFGYDRTHVYYGNKKLPKARPGHWAKIGGVYSREEDRVYYAGSLLRGADPDTFRVTSDTLRLGNLARDKDHYYLNGNVIEAAEFETRTSPDYAPIAGIPLVRP